MTGSVVRVAPECAEEVVVDHARIDVRLLDDRVAHRRVVLAAYLRSRKHARRRDAAVAIGIVVVRVRDPVSGPVYVVVRTDDVTADPVHEDPPETERLGAGDTDPPGETRPIHAVDMDQQLRVAHEPSLTAYRNCATCDPFRSGSRDVRRRRDPDAAREATVRGEYFPVADMQEKLPSEDRKALVALVVAEMRHAVAVRGG
jgi:hypothetical protein